MEYLLFVELSFVLVFVLVNAKKTKNQLASLERRIERGTERMEYQQRAGVDSLRTRIGEIHTSIKTAITNSKNEFIAKNNDSEDHLSGYLSSSNRQLIDMAKQISDTNEAINTATTILKDYAKQQTYSINQNLEASKGAILDQIVDTGKEVKKQQTEGLRMHTETIRKSENTVLQSLNKVQQNGDEISYKLNTMNFVWKEHLETLEPFEGLLSEINSLIQKLLDADKRISEQEGSINSMVASHLEIAELTNNLNKTASDVFELMRLYLMNSIVEYTKVGKK